MLHIASPGSASAQESDSPASDDSVAALVQVTPGDLDTSFSGDGKVTTDFSGGFDEAHALAVQPDGKLMVAGLAVASDGFVDFALARYLPTGTLDLSFSGDGKVTTDFSNDSNDIAFGLQSDGKFVVAGESTAGDGLGDFALARYNPNGTLDTTFSGDGKVLTDFNGSSFDRAHALVIQPDGKIVVAGISCIPFGPCDFALARYLSNGTLDSTFSSDGKVTTDFGGREEALALGRQPDGKIVAAGSSDASGNSNFALARYLSNGTLDPIFSGDGKVTTDFSGDFDEAHALVIQPDSTLVVAGLAVASSGFGDFALARYLSNGAIDSTFSGDGKVATSFGSDRDADATALVRQPDGKIVAAGVSLVVADTNENYALARYLPNDTLDSTFSGDGKLTTDFGSGGGTDRAFALALQPNNGRLVVAGLSCTSGNCNFALVRYHAIDCGGVAVTRVGTVSNDILNGTPSLDVIQGFDGNDMISGFGGNDILCGGNGNDTVRGGDGNDTVHGGSGDDALTGGAGTDSCDGGPHVLGDTASSCESVFTVP